MQTATIVGIGLGNKHTLTYEAKNAIENADFLIGAKRMLESFLYLKKPYFESFNTAEITECVSTSHFKNIVILMSGDTGFFSGTQKLYNLLSEYNYNVSVISGISSPIYFCSKIHMTWNDLKMVSLHGVNKNIVRLVASNKKVFVLLGGQNTVQSVCTKLCEYKLGMVNVYIGENLSYTNERILQGKAKDFTQSDIQKLSVMIIENNNFEHSGRSGISNDEFIRGNVPMTKSEVRSVVISKLAIGENAICWDIGSGTGSVSIEMALRCVNGTVYSVEKKSEAVMLTNKNRHKFFCDNIVIIEGQAPDVLAELPTPDNIFIGGTNGYVKDIIAIAKEKNAAVKVVVSAVCLETLTDTLEALKTLKFKSIQTVQIGVSKIKNIGTHSMLMAENPIFVITAE